MVCRQSRLSSAITTIARDMTGLQDNQVLSMYHELMREYNSGHTASADGVPAQIHQQQFIDDVREQLRTGRLHVAAGSSNPEYRLQLARQETPDPARLYASTRILARARAASKALREYHGEYARTMGVSQAHAYVEFDTAFAHASESGQVHASPAFRRAWMSNPAHRDLPDDRRSMYAFEQMQQSTAARAWAGDTRPAVTRQPVTGSTAIRELGYDPGNRRCEVVMHSNPDRVYAYRMDPATYETFRSAPSVGSFFARNVRGNPDHHYEDAAADTAAREHHRCPGCGQFAGAHHDCPNRARDGHREPDPGQVAALARAQAAGYALGDTPPPPPRLSGTSIDQGCPDGSGLQALRAPTVNRIRAAARHDDIVDVPVSAQTGHGDVVTGQARVEHLGNGVFAVTAPDDPGSRLRELACTCEQYRQTYHCPHTDAVLSRLHETLNAPRPAPTAATRQAVGEVNTALAAEHATAEAAAAAARDGFAPARLPETGQPLATDMPTFQHEYATAATAATAWRASGDDNDFPVEYQRGTGALGGLCTRESGRGFGCELEYSFPNTMSHSEVFAANARIGEQLRDAGLTRSSRQQHYGASHGAMRTQHSGGWSFESDPSTGGGTHRAGGEIVSPVMYDEAETWTNVEKVCKILRDNGAVASPKSGSHVHVGTGDFDHNVAAYNRLLADYAANEDLLYRLSTDPARGRHRGGIYCRPNTVPSTPYTASGTAAAHHTGHGSAINMQSMRGRPSDHVEFRMFDSTLQPAAIQTQIMIAAGMTARAGRETTPVRTITRDPVGSARQTHGTARLRGEAWEQSTAGFRRFTDTIIPAGPGAATRIRQMISLFAVTRWQTR